MTVHPFRSGFKPKEPLGLTARHGGVDHADVPTMERYPRVRGAQRVERITDALEKCGATILRAPDPTLAPFEYRIRTPTGETLDLICYAFTANEYRQGKRPKDEHRFQVKYGGDFKRVHEIYVDPSRARVTLMFGVHDELELFVAVDPMMHHVTWFSRSIELKSAELQQALADGWHGWERERSSIRRRVDPRQDLRAESVLAFRPTHFMRYIELERVATGMDPGERLLLIDRIAVDIRRGVAPSTEGIAHSLEAQLGLSATEILDVIRGRQRLLTAVLGGVAELHLERYLRAERDISDVERLDQDGPPDFRVRFRNRDKLVRVECKNVRGRVSKAGPWVDFQKTRAAKGNPCSRYYAASQFEVLAACLHPVTEKWDFRFRRTTGLPEKKGCDGKLAERVVVAGPEWTASLPELLERLTG